MSFEPQFSYAATIDDAAEIINRPHEPKAVLETIDCIRKISRYPIIRIGELLVRQVHAEIAWWLTDRGSYRRVPVRIGGKVLDYFTIPQQMSAVHPFAVVNVNDLKCWYTQFEEIHPFEDGNGRVGGAIIAGVSLALFGNILVPMQ